MKQKLSTTDQIELMMNLAQMVTEVDARRQCSNITRWFKQHFPVQGIGFLLKKPGFSQPHLHMEEVPPDTIEVFEGILRQLDFSKAAADDFMVFPLEEGKLTIFDPKDIPPSSKSLVLTIQLNANESSLGSLALVTDLETVQDLTGEKSPLPKLTRG